MVANKNLYKGEECLDKIIQLNARGQYNMNDLARELKASRSSVYRKLKILRIRGYKIHSAPGINKWWYEYSTREYDI
jgi:predicted transcriptional regulator